MPVASYYLWQIEGGPITVAIDLEAVNRIRAVVAANPAREIGGLLLGRIEDDSVTVITDFEEVVSEHRRGVIYDLSPKDRDHLARRITARQRSRKSGTTVVGLFRSHHRPGLFLDESDNTVVSSFFNGAWQVVLLVKPSPNDEYTGGFFFWEDGEMNRRQTYLPFPFNSMALAAVNLAGPAADERFEIAEPERQTASRPEPVRLPVADAGQTIRKAGTNFPAADNRSRASRGNLPMLALLLIAGLAGAGYMAYRSGSSEVRPVAVPISSAPPPKQVTPPPPPPEIVAERPAAPVSVTGSQELPKPPASVNSNQAADKLPIKPAPKVTPVPANRPPQPIRTTDVIASSRVAPANPTSAPNPVPQPKIQKPRALPEVPQIAEFPRDSSGQPLGEVLSGVPAPIRAAPQRREARAWVAVSVIPVEASSMRRAISHVPLLKSMQRGVYKGGSDFEPAHPLGNLRPVVPPDLARQIATDIPVQIRLTVGKSGRVTSAELLSKSVDPGLSSLALHSAANWQFEPARIGERPVNSDVVAFFRFAPPNLQR